MEIELSDAACDLPAAEPAVPLDADPELPLRAPPADAGLDAAGSPPLEVDVPLPPERAAPPSMATAQPESSIATTAKAAIIFVALAAVQAFVALWASTFTATPVWWRC